MKPIYIQIAEWLESEILAENLKENERIYSQYQLADMFSINPATAAKGLNILADQGVVYKKRGLGMFVAAKARKMILEQRRKQVLEQMVLELVREAKRLSVDESQLIGMVRQAIKEMEEG